MGDSISMLHRRCNHYVATFIFSLVVSVMHSYVNGMSESGGGSGCVLQNAGLLFACSCNRVYITTV